MRAFKQALVIVIKALITVLTFVIVSMFVSHIYVKSKPKITHYRNLVTVPQKQYLDVKQGLMQDQQQRHGNSLNSQLKQLRGTYINTGNADDGDKAYDLLCITNHKIIYESYSLTSVNPIKINYSSVFMNYKRYKKGKHGELILYGKLYGDRRLARSLDSEKKIIKGKIADAWLFDKEDNGQKLPTYQYLVSDLGYNDFDYNEHSKRLFAKDNKFTRPKNVGSEFVKIDNGDNITEARAVVSHSCKNYYNRTIKQ